jgi:hypothetical protein
MSFAGPLLGGTPAAALTAPRPLQQRNQGRWRWERLVGCSGCVVVISQQRKDESALTPRVSMRQASEQGWSAP